MKHPATPKSARISEIFSSLQGEGPRVGEKHIFVRFEECHIHCNYCDELNKKGKEMTVEQVITEVERLELFFGRHSYVSLTGGEPLIYLPFLKPLIAKLKSRKLKVYLETDGIPWKALQQIIKNVDCVAMDMKPPSVTGERNFDEEHRKFLKIAKRKETFIKIVVSKEINLEEFENEIKIVEDVAPDVPVVLMPVSTEIEGHEDLELMKLLGDLQQVAEKRVSDVRIGIRLHKVLSIR